MHESFGHSYRNSTTSRGRVRITDLIFPGRELEDDGVRRRVVNCRPGDLKVALCIDTAAGGSGIARSSALLHRDVGRGEAVALGLADIAGWCRD